MKQTAIAKQPKNSTCEMRAMAPGLNKLNDKADRTLSHVLNETEKDHKYLDNEFRCGVHHPLGEGLMSLGELQKELKNKVGFGVTVPTTVHDLRFGFGRYPENKAAWV